jgi:CDP-glucose 4,6-dehydratase
MGKIIVTNAVFWKNKRVFVTGHTGFKGSWLSLWLYSMGARVIGYSLPAPTEPSLFELAKVAELCEHHIGDIRDYEKLSSVLKNANADIVLHLAAQPLVRLSYTSPIETYSTNVMGTAHLLEAIRYSPSVRAAVMVTTDKCYENKEWHYGYREIDPMGGYDPYSSSKGCAELVTAAYRNSFFNASKFGEHKVSIASARAGNVIGGGDWALDRLVPDIINAYAKGQKVLIRNPHAIRPWQHVLEPLSGYLALAEKAFSAGIEFAEAYNFGPSDRDCQPVGVLVDKITKLWGQGAIYEIDKSPQPHEASFLKLDSSKAHAKLGWQPKWDIDQALAETTSWYQVILANKSQARELTLSQIAKFSDI